MAPLTTPNRQSTEEPVKQEAQKARVSSGGKKERKAPVRLRSMPLEESATKKSRSRGKIANPSPPSEATRKHGRSCSGRVASSGKRSRTAQRNPSKTYITHW
eukprot:3892311-Amphidinium_carterae.2